MFQIQNKIVKEVVDIIIAFVIAFVFYQGLTFALNTNQPVVSVVSGSMEPVLHRGDLLLVQGRDVYEVNDIAIYQKPEDQFTIVHRIIEKTEEGFIFKGDNNPGPDIAIVPQNRIIGKVLLAVPLLGYPRLLLYAFGI